MASVSNVPGLARYVMSACPRHKSLSLEHGFQGQKHHSKVENRPILERFPHEYKHLPWSDSGPMIGYRAPGASILDFLGIPVSYPAADLLSTSKLMYVPFIPLFPWVDLNLLIYCLQHDC